ncbi:stage II sporulation protein GA (sporulation sigma-E factor processing peptidase) [Paenibacillus uliginis N3/975]|uniref:Stage II sporulation protein GA (Sporulation sigma-E factor processing peptidase) n=1 Tax=Paenibacillus uliginis N3/975 TaxID=1313296 RepID=A0A1X7HM61_9BACL|nr:stage II sporulation protein GA (sporulation sigma-E factor processing peptidase) [Paenibacillus uliginis N3/975]
MISNLLILKTSPTAHKNNNPGRFLARQVNTLVVYIDLIFLANLLIDGILLALTAWMRRLKPRWWRLSLSAAAGAMYVVMMFVPELTFLFTFLIKFGLSLIMLWIAFGFVSLQSYIRNLTAFYMVNFAAAGGIIGFHYLLQNSGELFSGIWFTASGGLTFELKVGFWFTCIAFFVVIMIVKAVQTNRRQVENRESLLGQVTVCIGEKKIMCTGLLDTGNQLSDPLTRTPVMVMEASLWESYLPPAWCKKLAEGEPDKLIMEMGSTDFVWQDRLRLVPYRGVNRGAAFMLAIKPDLVQIELGGKEYVTAKVLIGFDGGTLSGEGAYRAIIHPALTEGEGRLMGSTNEVPDDTGETSAAG